MSKRLTLLQYAVAVVLPLWVPSFLAQSASTGALTGTVTDQTGAIVPNTTVTVSNSATNQARTVTTGADGVYRVPFLEPGSYRVRFAAAGFKTWEVAGGTLVVTET